MGADNSRVSLALMASGSFSVARARAGRIFVVSATQDALSSKFWVRTEFRGRQLTALNCCAEFRPKTREKTAHSMFQNYIK
jgi:hypothetical protein